MPHALLLGELGLSEVLLVVLVLLGVTAVWAVMIAGLVMIVRPLFRRRRGDGEGATQRTE